MFPVGERKPGRTPELPAADEDASTAATRIAAAVERMSVAFMVPPIRLRPSSAGAATQPSRGRNDLATAGRLGRCLPRSDRISGGYETDTETSSRLIDPYALVSQKPRRL